MATALEVIDPASSDAAERLSSACEQLGFFRIPLSVIERSVADAAWADAMAFFDLDEAAKTAVGFPEPGYPYGYSPVAFETLAASRGEATPPDLKESFAVGPDCLGPVPTTSDPAEAWLRSPSVWPVEPAGIRASWSNYFRELSDVSSRLLSLMAVALDLPAGYFASSIDRHTSAMRAIRYPALDRDPPPRTLRAGAHTDYGTLTILRTDAVEGLEVEDRDGRWSPVAAEPDTFVVNLGDSISQWTNDRWRSTLHRVNTTGRSSPRTSMAFFHMANWDAQIECLPTCTSVDDPPRHESVLAGPWLMTKFQRSVA